MAKKISKHSRAARRGYEESPTEVRQLESLERPESNDVRKSIIRTVIKNEDLLNRKLVNKKANKVNKMKSKASKHRLERSDKLEGVLGTKIERSIQRAKFIQNARKNDWNTINKSINLDSKLNEISTEPEKSQEQLEKEEDEAYLNQFFDGDSSKSESSGSKKENKKTNKFNVLEETEA